MTPSPASRSKLRYYLVTLIAVAGLLIGIGIGRETPGARASRARAKLQAGLSLQEGLLAVPDADRVFSLVAVAQPEGLGRTSKLQFLGPSGVRVVARNRLSKSGTVTLHEALAQLSGELASLEPGGNPEHEGQLQGWRVELDFGDEVRATLRLSPEGKLLP